MLSCCDASQHQLKGWCQNYNCEGPTSQRSSDKPRKYECRINCEKQIKNSFQAAAGDIKGGQARPRTKIEPSMANQILSPPPGWSYLTEKPGAFVLRCFFSPAGSTTISSVPKQTLRASPFRSARTLSHCHSHHFLCMANSACTDEVTHQHGFTLYDFSQTISMLQQLSFPVMSVTMHRPCMTSYTSVNPTTKHFSVPTWTS